MDWKELALGRVGCGSPEQVQRKFGLPETGQWDPETCRLLWSRLAGYVWHRLEPGQTLYQVARQYGVSARAIGAANGCAKREPLPGQLLAVPLEYPVVPWEGGFSSQLQEVFREGLQARCPQLEAWPLAVSGGGRRVWCLRLGTGERRVLLTAGHHGNEWITSLLLWRILEDCCDGLRDDGSLSGLPCRQLFRRTTLYLVPLVNPDGADLAAGAIDPERAEYRCAAEMAAHRRDLPFPAGWKANLRGVDLNLNYPARWEQARARKESQPGPRDYPGSAPLDQPETAALAQLTRRLQPHAVAAWHTQGGEIYGAEPVPDGGLGEKLAAASGYVLTQPPPESGDAGYRDWVLQELRIPAYTIEAGRGENPLPLSDLPQLYRENLPIFVHLLWG